MLRHESNLESNFGSRFEIRRDVDGDFIPCADGGRLMADGRNFLLFTCPTGDLADKLRGLPFVTVERSDVDVLELRLPSRRVNCFLRAGVEPVANRGRS